MGLPCDWQVKKQKFSERAEYLLLTGQWSDCKFVVGQDPHQQILNGHKLFLAMSSPVFEAMFYGSMAEKNDPIPIQDVQPEAFKALLKYIYTDSIELGSFELACELCYCAKKYMLPFLVEECTKYLWADLSPKKTCRAYEFAKLFEEPVLMDKCLQIICSRTNEVLKESSWEDVELTTLTTILEQDELQIDSEMELFNAIERWAKAECNRKSLDSTDAEALKSVIGNALSKIRFLTMTPQEFAEGPGCSLLLTKNEAFGILVNIICSGNGSGVGNKVPMPEGFSSEINTRTKQIYKTPSMNFDISRLRQVTSPLNGGFHQWSSVPSTSFSQFLANNDAMGTSRNTSPIIIEGGMKREPGGNSVMNNSSGMMVEGSIRDGPKYYCLRSVLQQTECLNTSVLDCSLTFNVDKNICVIGVQVPTQIAGASPNLTLPSHPDSTYTEILYASLHDSDGTRLTYTHFTTKANFGTLVEITFNRPVYIQKHKIYKVAVGFNKVGWYPMGMCTQNMTCDAVFFSFGVGNSVDNVRDGLIRSIVFTCH